MSIDPERIDQENLISTVRDLQRQLNWLLKDYKRAGQVFNDYSETVEDRFEVVEKNREKSDNVTEVILGHLGIDLSKHGDPPIMNKAEIETALADVRRASLLRRLRVRMGGKA